METLHFEQEFVPARTITFYEILETYLKHNLCLDSGDCYATKRAFALLFELFPNVDTSTFSALNLLEFQQFLVSKKYCRNYCNKLVKLFRSVLNWGAQFDLVPYNLVFKLNRVKLLRFGQYGVKESKKRKNVPENDVEAVISHIRPIVADMLQLQLLTAMRPSEICRMKPEEIDMKHDDENWLYLPPKHKTAWRGKERCILLGQEEQNILKKYMREPDKHVFLNGAGQPFSVRRYGKIIKKTIEKNKLPKFTSYQLRHSTITSISSQHDRDTARAVAGHSSELTTGIYDHADLDKAKIVIKNRKKKVARATEVNLPSIPTLRIFTGE